MDLLKIKEHELGLLDPEFLTVTQKLVRLELMLATIRRPELGDIEMTWQEIINNYSDDLKDDPDYHGYSEEDLQYVISEIQELSWAFLIWEWKKAQEEYPELVKVSLEKAIELFDKFEDNPKGDIENLIDSLFTDFREGELSIALKKEQSNLKIGG